MELKAIVYNSSAGTTQRYAERLGQLTGLPVYTVKEAQTTLSGASVFFMSWICAGILMQYDKASKLFHIAAASATGMGSEELARKDLEGNHGLCGDNLFFLPGTFKMKKLKLVQRIMMKDMYKELSRRIRNHPDKVTQADRDTLKALKYGVDYYDESCLDAIAEWIAAN